MTGLLLGGATLATAWLGWPGAVAGVAVSAAVVLLTRQDRDGLLAVLLVALSAAVMGFRFEPRPDVTSPAWIGDAEAVRGVVVTAPGRGNQSDSFVLAVDEVQIGEAWSAADSLICVSAPKAPVAGLGDRVWIPGSPVGIEDQPARFRGAMRARRCGAMLFARVLAVETTGGGWQRSMADARDRFSASIAALAPGDAGALMSGLVTGADEGLSKVRKDNFLETGTTHITAVSGSNFATLVTLLAAAGTVAGWRRRMSWIAGITVAIWLYAVFVGLDPPATRAALVATAALIAVRAGRRPDVVTLGVLAGAAMAIAAPGIVWQLGFTLSLAASLALAATANFGDGGGLRAYVQPLLLSAIAAQIATLPLLLPLRGDLPLSSLPANILIAPLVGFAFPMSAVAGIVGLIWRPGGEVTAIPAKLAVDATIAVVDWMAGVGGTVPLGAVSRPVVAIIAVGSAAACVALSADGQRLWRQWPERWRRWDEWQRSMVAGGLVGIALMAAVLAVLAT